LIMLMARWFYLISSQMAAGQLPQTFQNDSGQS